MIRLLKFLLVLAIVIVPGLIYQAQECCAQQYYQGGDINYDGWCNLADLNILVGYLGGNCSDADFCMGGADFNGNGIVNGADATGLLNFLNGSGPAPTGFCPDVSRTCDLSEQATIWLTPVADGNPDQATFSVFIEASTNIGALNFTFEYDPLDIASFSAVNPSNINAVSVNERVNPDIVGFLVMCASNGNGASYPAGVGGTRIFDIIISRQAGAQNSTMRITEDPIHGPAYFYYAGAGHCAGEDIICPFVWRCPGDVNGNCVYNGLDITYGVNYFKGGQPIVSFYFYTVPVVWNY